jgi:hypothetical protein
MGVAVSLITPTFSGDLESCRLLCDSIDAFATGYDKHYLVVADADLPLFQSFRSPKRDVLPDSVLLPGALHPLRAFLKWKNRQYYWVSGAGLPVYGWHIQQLRKIAMTLSQPCPRVICIDSDNCFVRPFDAAKAAAGPRSPLYLDRGAITSKLPNHVLWQKNAYHMLGRQEPPLPGNDYIGQMIVWDRESLQQIVARLETVTRRAWWKALCRVRHFSEYILYGVGVMTQASLRERHELIEHSMCATYWSGPSLDTDGVRSLIAGLDETQYAIAIQSHTATSPAAIREAVFGVS